MTGRRTPEPGLAEDRELREELQELQGQWRADQGSQPPEHLDLAVLRAARAALPAGRRRAWPWTRGWIHNLATAAVVVLAVTLLVEMRQAAQEEQDEAASALPEQAFKSMQAPQAAEPAAIGAAAREYRTARISQADDADTPAAEEWLEHMQGLYDEGKFETLAQEVERFRAAYPDTPIPEHLLR